MTEIVFQMVSAVFKDIVVLIISANFGGVFSSGRERILSTA
jgi:hypothetical protein